MIDLPFLVIQSSSFALCLKKYKRCGRADFQSPPFVIFQLIFSWVSLKMAGKRRISKSFCNAMNASDRALLMLLQVL